MSKIENSFAKKDKLVKSFDEDILQTVQKTREVFFKKDIFSPSNISECPRKLVFRASHIEETIKYSQLLPKIRNQSNLQKWVDLLSKCSKIKILERDFIVADGRLNLTGTLDFVVTYIDGNKERHKAGIKVIVVDPDVFQKVSTREAYRKDVVDIMTCIWMAELPLGFLIYDNLNSEEFTTYNVNVYKPIIESVKLKCEKLVQHQIKGTLPKRPYQSKNTKECQSCGFIQTCWNNN